MKTVVFSIFCILALVYAQSSEESVASIESLESPEEQEVPEVSISDEVDSDEVAEIIIDEGSGSGDSPVQLHVFGILPGPADIRKKRDLMDVLMRK